MDQAPVQIESSSDDRLWVLLGYIFTPIIPIIILLMADKKDRPFIKAHNMQALILGIAEIILGIVLGIVTFGIGSCLVFLLWIYNIYLAIKANRGEVFDIPVISSFVRKQGW
jgi:uncharacterized protein